MGAIGTLGRLDVGLSADPKQAIDALKAVGGASDAAALKMKAAARVSEMVSQAMGKNVSEVAKQTAAAAGVQERAHARALAAWNRELLQQEKAAAAAAETGRAQELAALKADILTRSLEKQGGVLSGLKDRFALTTKGVQLSARDWLSAFSGLGEVMGVGLIAGMGVDQINKVASYANELGHLSDKTGMAATSLAGLQAIAAEMGVEWDPIANGLVRLNHALAEAPYEVEYGRALKEIGLDLKDLNPATTTAEQRLQTLAIAFQKHAGTAAAADAAIELFGRGGAALIPILEAEGAQLQENMNRTAALTGVTRESVTAAQQWTHDWEQIGIRTRAALIPGIWYADQFLHAVFAIGDGILGTFTAAAAAVEATVGTIGQAVVLMAKLKADVDTGMWQMVPGDLKNAWAGEKHGLSALGAGAAKPWKDAWGEIFGVTKPSPELKPGADIDTSKILPPGYTSAHMKAAEDNLSEMKAGHAMSLQEEEDYWRKLAAGVAKGSALYNAYLKKANDLTAEILKQRQKDWADMVVQMTRSNAPAPLLAGGTAAERSASGTEMLRGTWDEDFRKGEEQRKKLQEAASKAFTAAEQERQAAMRLQEERIRLEEETGQLSRHQAALAMQTLHEESFAQWSAASASFSAQFPDMAVPGATGALSQHDRDSAMDAAAVSATSNLGQFSDALSRTAQDMTAWGTHVAETITRGVSGVNDQILNMMTQPHYQTKFGNVGAQFFRGIANTGLQNMEGRAMKLLGFGGGVKPDGTPANPLYVRMADAIGHAMTGGGNPFSNAVSGIAKVFGRGGGSAVSSVPWAGIGGALSSVFRMGAGGAPAVNLAGMGGDALSGLNALTSSLPGFADGGSIPSNMPAIVGERGPELFLPSSSGRIVPNHQLGGDTHNHNYDISIDARGSTDPAAVEAAAHRAVRAAAPQIVAASMASMRNADSRRVKSTGLG